MFKTFAPRSAEDIWPFAEQPHAGTPISLTRRLAAGLRAIVEFVIERNRLIKAQRDLACLDERMLRDIGINRSEIGRIVRYGRFD